MKSDPEVSLSARMIEYLRQRGMTLRKIADILGVSESYISRVANKQRSLTMGHLAAIEDYLGEPLPFFLIEADLRDQVPAEHQEMFAEAVSLLRQSFNLRSELMTGETDTSEDENVKGTKRRRRGKTNVANSTR